MSSIKKWFQLTGFGAAEQVLKEGLMPVKILGAQALYLLEPFLGGHWGDVARRLEHSPGFDEADLQRKGKA